LRLRVLAAVALMAVLFVGVVAYIYGGVAGARRALVVATTTSLYDTGLLDEVADEYARRYGVRLYFISVGTGLALKHAERGDADAVLVHAPSEEARFLAGGLRRREKDNRVQLLPNRWATKRPSWNQGVHTHNRPRKDRGGGEGWKRAMDFPWG